MREYGERRTGAVALENGSVRWRAWAPNAERMEVILFHDGARRPVRMTPTGSGHFEYTAPNVREGQRYTLRCDNAGDRPDPASLWQPEGVFGPSAVLRFDDWQWSEGPWNGIQREALVFYELHVGTFTPEGTFDAVIPRLPELHKLGVTAIEIMPIAQFSGARNWGYDGVYLYAPQNTYGGPQGFHRLVNACHQQGLAIFLDVVYNHLGPEGNFLGEFAPYFADRYRTFWGPALNYDGPGSDQVRDFIVDNVRMWIAEYRLDGLRLDAVHAIYDHGPRHILQAVKEAADEAAASLGRPVHIIAESDLNDVRLLLPPEKGGYGLDGQWNDDFHHSVHAYLTGERHSYYVDFGSASQFPKVLESAFVLDGIYSKHRNRRHGAPAYGLPGDRFVGFIQNHDQVGNRARGNRLSTLVDPPALRLAGSLLLLSPQLPLLFMGEEYGEENPFLYFCSFADPRLAEAVRQGRRNEFKEFAWQGEVPDPQSEATFAASRLTWSWPPNSWHSGLRNLYHDLLAARRRWPALKDYEHRSAALLPNHEHGPLLQLVRGANAGQRLHVWFNLTRQTQPVPGDFPGSGTILFSSEARRYGGCREPPLGFDVLLPYECVALGPGEWGEAGD